MSVAAFVLLAGVLTGYVLLDGYDLGVGVMHLFTARSDTERSASLAVIGPFWNGNEVMLIAAGAMLFALFPRAYAAAFSGFYLPFMVVLWLLMVRGTSIELRGHFSSELWRGFWDVSFALSSALLAMLFGIAIGNVLRGVPIDRQGYFAGTFAFLLNGYAIGVGLLALFALGMHGAAFANWRSTGPLAQRSRRAMLRVWPIVLVLYIAVTYVTLHVHPLPASPALWIAPSAGAAALLGVLFLRRPALAFTASSLFLAALMASAAQALFPFLLPAFPIGTGGLDIHNAAPEAYALHAGVTASAIGLGAVLIYATLTARRLLGRVKSSGD